jgi:hypothetical protein
LAFGSPNGVVILRLLHLRRSLLRVPSTFWVLPAHPTFPAVGTARNPPPTPHCKSSSHKSNHIKPVQELIYDGWRWQFSLFSNTPESLHFCRNHSSGLFSQIVRRIARSGTEGLPTYIHMFSYTEHLSSFTAQIIAYLPPAQQITAGKGR